MAEPIPLSGGIDPRSFPYLLSDLHRQQATGSLRVEGPSYQKALYLRSGRVLFGSSNDPRDQLGAILIESGRLTAEQLEEVNSRVGPGNPLAKLLSESGIVSQRELGEAARSKVERILSDLLTYEQGSYDFEDGVLPKGAVDLKLSTGRLMLAAARRVEERAFVLRHVESLQTVLAPLAGLETDAEELRPEIGSVLEKFDGQRTLKEVATAAGTEDFDTARIACALLFLGLLHPAAEAATVVPNGGSLAEPEPGTQGGEIDLAAEAAGAFAEGGGEPTVEPDPEPAGAALGAEDDDATLAIPAPDFSSHATDPAPEGGELDFAADAPGPELGWQPEADSEPAPEPEPAWQPEAGGEPAPEPEPAEAAWQPPPEPGSPPPPMVSETRPPVARPSREDLAALDALLNNRALEEGPLEPLEKPADADWKPQFLPGGGTRPPRGRASAPSRSGAPSRLPVLLGVGAVLAAAAGGIYALGGPEATLARIRGLTGGTQVAEVPPAPEPVAQPALPTPTPAPAEPGGTAADATPASGGPTTPTPEPAASPMPEPPPQTPGPAPATPAPAAPTPAPVTSTGSTPPSVDAARAALRGGRFADAARGFAAQLRGTAPFTLQILVACSTETLAKANQAVDAPELYVLPVTLDGRACYRVCWGLFGSEAEAERARGQIHRYFIDNGARPRVVRSETLF